MHPDRPRCHFLREHARPCGDETSLLDVARVCGLQRYRVDKAMAMLRETPTEIAEIALTCGFADQSHLTRVFARMVGDSPASWRRHRRN